MTTEIVDRNQIYPKLVEVLHETFDIEPAKVQLETHLYQDLDIDSIDTIDLLVKLQSKIGKRVKPEMFKGARTVQDVVNVIATLMAE
jgi:acyl carrier protein